MVKSLPAVLWETWVGKKPLEKEMATHSSILAWKIPGTEEPGGLQPMGLHRVSHAEATEPSSSTAQEWPPLCLGASGHLSRQERPEL